MSRSRERAREWGPVLWRVLHSAAAQPETSDLLGELMRDIGYVLPCKYCRRSVRLLWPAVLGMGVAMEESLWILHNMVTFKIHRSRGASAEQALAQFAPVSIVRQYHQRLSRTQVREARQVARVISGCTRRRASAAVRNGRLDRFLANYSRLVESLSG